MNAHVFRRLGVALVFAGGIGAILATSPPPPPFHFRETNIRPDWRCPGADVEISWNLSKAAPVTVLIGGKEQVTTAAAGATLPAELLDRNAPVAEVALRIEAEDADYPRDYEITTLGRERTIEDAAYHKRRMAFRMNQTGVWDERIRITGFEVEQVRNLVCEGAAVSPPAWEVSPPTGDPFVLRAAQDYSSRLDPPLAPGRIWRIRPVGGKCRLPASGLQPYLTIRFTAVCVGAGSAS